MAPSKNLSTRIAVAAALVLLAAGVLCAVAAASELANVRRGIDEGFELRGTYQSGSLSLVFGYDAEDAWLLQDFGAGEDVGGAVETTADPNVYVLRAADGAEAGRVHLAYANGKGEGTVYAWFGSDEAVRLPKVNRMPSVVVMP